MDQFESIFNQFISSCKYVDSVSFGNGNIHQTYYVNTIENKGFILQKINTTVFKDQDVLMANSVIISDHLSKKLKMENLEWAFPVFYKTKDNDFMVKTEEGEYWRLMDFIENEPIKKSKGGYVEIAGASYGQFIRLLGGLNPELILDTIPDFHNLEKRMNDFRYILESGDGFYRKNSLKEIEFLLSREERNMELQRLKSEGLFPVRLVHNDTKLDNILFDRNGNPKAIVDLDTVMKGSVHSDFGDAIRSFANSTREDERDLSKVTFDMQAFNDYAKGFIHSLKSILTTNEKNTLAMAPAMWVYMQAVRFLSDYLGGSPYYNIKYPEHNLVRAKNQIKLLQEIEKKQGQMEEIILNYFDT